MITLTVKNKTMTWPHDFAVFMIKFYQDHGIPFRIHADDIAGEQEPPDAAT